MNMSDYFDENLISRWQERAKDVLQAEEMEWKDAADETGYLYVAEVKKGSRTMQCILLDREKAESLLLTAELPLNTRTAVDRHPRILKRIERERGLKDLINPNWMILTPLDEGGYLLRFFLKGQKENIPLSLT